jgi:hypothetical protein
VRSKARQGGHQSPSRTPPVTLFHSSRMGADRDKTVVLERQRALLLVDVPDPLHGIQRAGARQRGHVLVVEITREGVAAA